METRDKTLKLSEEQALFFRSRRSFLAAGAATAAQCARDLLGLQSLSGWLELEYGAIK